MINAIGQYIGDLVRSEETFTYRIERRSRIRVMAFGCPLNSWMVDGVVKEFTPANNL